MAHTFAVYAPESYYRQRENTLYLEDMHARFRLVSILRVNQGDTIILFDDTVIRTVCIEKIDRHAVQGVIVSQEAIVRPAYRCDVIVPLLSKEYMEIALYAAGVHGITTVYITSTQSSRREPKDMPHDRYQRIIRSAQEQAKQFVPVRIVPCNDLTQACDQVQSAACKLIARKGASTLRNYIDTLHTSSSIAFTIGPEADYTPDEYDFLQKSGFLPISLGKSILRSCDAFSVISGMISICKE